MKIIKRIKTANVVQKESMLYVLGGAARSNNNQAEHCGCHGGNTGFWCSDNTNKADYCFCTGTGSNTNGYSSCKCS